MSELRAILEDTNTQWRLVRDTLAGLRNELAAAGPPVGQQLGAAPAAGVNGGEGPPTAPLAAPKPKASSRRSSAFATTSLTDVGQTCAALGGRVISVETGSELLGELECVIIEPTGKKVAPQAFVSTGLIVCLQGMPSSQESIEEWCKAAVRAGWLNLGASVAVPNLQMNAALQLEDLQSVLKGTLAKAGFSSCVLVGKDWGGVIAAELAASEEMGPQIEGVVLVGPNTPVPPNAGEVAVPVLLIWARDDDISPFEDWEEWLEALDGRCMPTTIKDCETGAHQFDQIMNAEGVSEVVKSFTVSAFMLSELEAIEEEGEDEDEDEENSKEAAKAEEEQADSGSEECEDISPHMKRNQRLTRLQAELPAFLQAASPQLAFPTEELSEEGPAPVPRGRQSTTKRLSLALPQWIQAGMTRASE